MRFLVHTSLAFMLLMLLFAPVAAADPPPARRTEMVQLVERCLPAVVSVRTFAPGKKPGENLIHHGSGTIIHEAGVILTNAHVCRDFLRGEVQLPSGKVLPYTIVCKFVQEDLALLKVNSEKPLPALPLGRSNDLMLGEPTLIIGNAGELSHSVSAGMVSGLKRSTKTENAFLPDVIQTTAAINGGNSGGPMINALGELIGVVVSKKADADNIGFAIAVDRARTAIPAMIAAEQQFGYRLGISVDMLAPVAAVNVVALDGPAHAAGFASGDIVKTVGGLPVRQGVDFHLALLDRKPEEKLALQVDRGGKLVDLVCSLSPLSPLQSVAAEGKVPGLKFAAYKGDWKELPAFGELKEVSSGVSPTVAANAYPNGKEHFGLVFTGYVKAPTDGLYTISVRSHDGSRIYLGDKLVGEAIRIHPAPEAAGRVRLAAGLHPLRIEWVQIAKEIELTAYWEGPNLARQEIPADVLFSDPAM